MTTDFAMAVCDAMEHSEGSLQAVFEKYNLGEKERELLRLDHENGQYFNSLKFLAADIASVPPEVKTKLNQLIALRENATMSAEGQFTGIPVTGMC